MMVKSFVKAVTPSQRFQMLALVVAIVLSSVAPVFHGTANAKPGPTASDPLGVTATNVGVAADASATAPLAGNHKAVSNSPVISPGKLSIKPHELTAKRTATSDTHMNADGTLTTRNYPIPHYYKTGNSWQTIDTHLVQDTNSEDAKNLAVRWFNAAKNKLFGATALTVKANDWQARFASSNFSGGMVRIEQGSNQVGFVPVGAASVKPRLTTDKSGHQTVHYDNLWRGVNVTYAVDSAQVKESIELTSRAAASSVAFRVVGADLVAPPSSQPAVAYTIRGLDGSFAISKVNLILKKFGMVTNAQPLSQSYRNHILQVSIDKTYLSKLPQQAFPAVIDPGVIRSFFGSRAGGNYVDFKTDGYICYSNVCNLYGGSLYDSQWRLQYWRGAFFSPYDQFRNPNIKLTHANFHITQLTGVSFWTGTYDTHPFYLSHATCLNNFNCIEGGWWSAGNVSTAGDIDATSLYQTMIARSDFGAWMMVGSEDGTTSSFKNIDPDNSFVDFTYVDKPPAPSFSTPVNNQVYVDPQASLHLNGVNNPNGTPLKYEILVSSGPGGVGNVIDSGLINSTQWTVPDGVLQDGSTYYVMTRDYDQTNDYWSDWSSPVSFKIDTRTGQDKTQTYDSSGPVSVDVATGNLTTGASSHTTTALGGTLGVSLTYNSPLKSRNGLVGEYWNLPANYNFGNGPPSGTPDLKRVDQNLDFNWAGDSPQSGMVNANWFYARWTGYFVAPEDDTYTFGGNNDDAMTVKVNGTVYYSSGICPNGVCYGSNTLTLKAGQVVPIEIDYEQATGPAYIHFYVHDGWGDDLVQPSDLQTGIRATGSDHGLVGHYYYDDGSHNLDSTSKTQFLGRTDPLLSFNWGTGSPIPNGPVDNFMVRWTGYLTVPTSGNYYFGAMGDDGTRVTVNGAKVEDYWQDTSPVLKYGSNIALQAGQTVPITVDYYEHGGGATVSLYVKGDIPEQIVPANWLTPKAQVLPNGWSLGIDADGNVNYDHLIANQSSVILTDSSGDTHEYTWTGSGYKPPAGEDGQLIRNADGSFSLQDVDGRTYVFGSDGILQSVTNPVDDTKPAALQYTYAGTPAKLVSIADGVNSGRYAKLYYSGDSQCATPPSGFDSAPPPGMLCAVVTNDGRQTNFFYLSGQLARIQKPGDESTDYQYEAPRGNDGNPIGYRLLAIRDSLAYDAIKANLRTAGAFTTTQISYDGLGRAQRVTLPAANVGDSRQSKSYEYFSPEDYAQIHIAGAPEPEGFSERVTYDNLFRTISVLDNEGNGASKSWDPNKDLLYSSTDKYGNLTSSVYDDEDRPITSYGPAPSSWFNASTDAYGHTEYLPAPGKVVPQSDTHYDEGIVGPAVAWYDYAKVSPNPTGMLYGAPRLHTTGLTAAAPGTMSLDFSKAPISASSGMQGIGLSATGKLRLPNGNYTIKVDSSDGVRVWVDDQLVLDGWNDGGYQTRTSNSFSVNGPLPKRLRIDTYRQTGSTGAFNVWLQSDSGLAATTNWSSYLQPDYSLATSTTVHDQTVGDVTNTVNYGTNPELGLPQSSTVSGGGLSLATQSTYEAPGSGFLRKTSNTEPGGGGAVIYSYYGAGDTADNPCTSQTESYKQGGMMRLKTMLDPDGSGPRKGQTVETIYDDAGRNIATRANEDPWTCTTYDDRGRITQVITPSVNGRPGRTVTTNYAVGGNPLIQSSTDSATGTTTTQIDLLGRTVATTDSFGYQSHVSFDNLGRPTYTHSLKGNERVVYDQYSRISQYQLNGLTYAIVTYDDFGDIASVNYPQATNDSQSLALTIIKRDETHQAVGSTYTMSDGSVYDESVTKTVQTGMVTADAITFGGKTANNSYQYDAVGRLAGATIDNWKYSYGFGVQDASCTTAGTNVNSGGDGNRTTSSITNTLTSVTQSTTNCYNFADQMTSSSDPQLGTPTYDDHGNTTQLAGNGTPITFTYNANDQNIAIQQGGNKVEYVKDAGGNIIARREYRNNQLSKVYRYTGGAMLSCSTTNQSSCSLLDRYIALPGNVELTLAAASPTATSATYSLNDFHGDTALTVGSNGAATSSVYLYDPFGQIVNSATFGTNAAPANASDNGMGWAASPLRKFESLFSTPLMQMGARVYLASAGRFLQVDPVQGGTPNAYTYVLDPINYADYAGTWGWPKWVKNVVKAVVIAVVVVAVVALAVLLLPDELVAGAIAVAAKIASGIGSAIRATGGAISRAGPAVRAGSSWAARTGKSFNGLFTRWVYNGSHWLDNGNEMPKASVNQAAQKTVTAANEAVGYTDKAGRPMVSSQGYNMTQYYYQKLISTGRGDFGARATNILNNTSDIQADPKGYPGFYKYSSDGWDLIYNPEANEISHLGPSR